MADLPLPQIREKKFRQQEIDLDQFTDEELCSRYRFGRESIQYLVEILKKELERQTRRKHKQLPTWLLLHVINLVIIKHGARSIQPNFPEISVQKSMDRFGPTGKVSEKRVHLLRWSSFPGRTGWNFG